MQESCKSLYKQANLVTDYVMVNWELERWNPFTTIGLAILEILVWLESNPEIMELMTFTRFCHNHGHFSPFASRRHIAETDC